MAQELLPLGRGPLPLLVLGHHGLVELAAAAVDVDLVELEEARTRAGVLVALPEVAADVADGDDEEGEEVVEEGLCAVALDRALECGVDLEIAC